MFQVLDELEANEKSSPEVEPKVNQAEEVPKIQDKEEKSSVWKEIKKFFTSAQQLKDFVRFIKNGFKIK